MLYDKMMGIGSKVVKACAIILLGTGCNEHPAPAKTANDLERTLRAGGKLATISTEVKGKKLNSNLIDRTDA
ncbi:MAG: hypothetical protein KJ709_05255, partial [Nanoarchaeota archaeon]|nr:hypothetical protein [Nanoarchaeota archaeon]